MSATIGTNPRYTETGATRLAITTCGTCGIVYAIPDKMMKAARERGHSQITWTCPNGHSGIGFHDESGAESAAARAERERLRADANQELLRETERRLSAQRGATTKARKRHAAGVCPVCTRSFKQVREHMERMHPDYDPSKRS